MQRWLEMEKKCGFFPPWKLRISVEWLTSPGGQYRIYAEDLLASLDNRGMRIPEELLELQRQQENSKVLIVDDDKELNNMIKQFIGRKLGDWIVEQAFDGFEAGVVLSREKPDAVILDIDLPGVNGH